MFFIYKHAKNLSRDLFLEGRSYSKKTVVLQFTGNNSSNNNQLLCANCQNKGPHIWNEIDDSVKTLTKLEIHACSNPSPIRLYIQTLFHHEVFRIM